MRLESEHNNIGRRQFLGMLGAGPLLLYGSGVLAAPAPAPDWDRLLILLELKGGNDGLNTVIPYADPAYHRLRPNLGIDRGRVLQLNEQLGLHPGLEPLMALWREQELAIALGVGYENPNRSHFRSIEIWETASDSDEYLAEGWLAQLFSQHRPPADLLSEGIVLGGGEAGPLEGSRVRTIAMQSPERFVRQARKLEEDKETRQTNPALAHLLSTREEIRNAADTLDRELRAATKLQTEFPRTNLGRQVETAVRLVASGTGVAAIKLSLGGFDTHNNQPGTHERLMGELAEGLIALRAGLLEAGAWQHTLVMTYSEFGRRARENGSRGTDHGTAAPHLLLGGRVKGGFYGSQPSLTQLTNGDLKHSVDFRQLYATVARRWWQLPGAGSYAPLDCLRD